MNKNTKGSLYLKYIIPVFIALVVGLLFLFTFRAEKEVEREATKSIGELKGGMSKEQVKVIEKSKLIAEEDSFLCYETKIHGLDTLLYFVFNHRNQLYLMKYAFMRKHINQNWYIYDFKKVDTILRKKYGKPDVHKEIWRRDLYKNDRDNWGMAMAVGDLGYFTQWKGETSISHSLSGDNFKINHSLIYSNTKLEKEYEEFKGKKKLEKEF
ncbi:MAG: hypothetical protein GTO13_00565 [Proteobacteria bacterium]|nr:hypothetical protein [Pseudomonadota bacterium]